MLRRIDRRHIWIHGKLIITMAWSQKNKATDKKDNMDKTEPGEWA